MPPDLTLRESTLTPPTFCPLSQSTPPYRRSPSLRQPSFTSLSLLPSLPPKQPHLPEYLTLHFQRPSHPATVLGAGEPRRRRRNDCRDWEDELADDAVSLSSVGGGASVLTCVAWPERAERTHTDSVRKVFHSSSRTCCCLAATTLLPHHCFFCSRRSFVSCGCLARFQYFFFKCLEFVRVIGPKFLSWQTTVSGSSYSQSFLFLLFAIW